MSSLVAVAIHAISFALFVVFAAPASVSPGAWLGLYLAGFLFVLGRPRLFPLLSTPKFWASTFAYAALLATIFAGADLALTALGNSVKARAPLSGFLGGLEFYFVLVPGVAAVALAELGRFLASKRAEPSISGSHNSATPPPPKRSKVERLHGSEA